VQRGGTAVVTGLAGRYDRFGFALGEHSLIRRAGLRGVHRRDPMVFNRYQGKPEGLRAQVIDLAAGVMPELPRQVAVPPTYRFDAVPLNETVHEVLATFADGAPAILSLPSGKGRYLWIGVLPGAAVAQRRMDANAIEDDCLSPAGLDLIQALVRLGAREPPPVHVEGQGLLSSAWRRDGRIWIRMVNVGGAMPQPGRRVGDLTVTYPPLERITLHLRLPGVDTATLLTPDAEAPRGLTVQTRDGVQTIDIPAGAFRRFAVVRVEVPR
ncbi:MAG: hypothetical protein GX595_04735, partial [Lentisphaerae bacterium]|nr:hypothetical protein [Lentisphaerota bacterium]